MICKRFHHKAPYYPNKTLTTRVAGKSFYKVCAKELGIEIIRLSGFVGCFCHGVFLNLIDRSVRLTEKKKGKAMNITFPDCGLISIEKLSNLENIYKLLNSRRTLLKSCAFVVCQADLDDLFDTVLAELDRHADEEIVDAVLAFEKHRAR